MRNRKTIGDAAVDGLLAGMAAGVVMGAMLVLLGLLDGTRPLEIIGRFDPADGSAAVVGGLLHLAMSGIYGVLFALLYRFLVGRWTRLKRSGWLIGAGFGLALWLAAQFIYLPGLDTALVDIAPLHFVLGHLAYGATLGYLLGRHEVV
jgi:hypothetical protein